MSLNQGKILSPQLKDQIISPIHKKGRLRAAELTRLNSEYRPIPLTSHLTKIFDRADHDRTDIAPPGS